MTTRTTPLHEIVTVRSFLILRPEFVLRKTDIIDDYTMNRVWPEVLLFMHEGQATSTKNWLTNAYNAYQLKRSEEEGKPYVRELQPYVVEPCDDEKLYTLIHRVPTSIKNLMQLEETTGYLPSGNIVLV